MKAILGSLGTAAIIIIGYFLITIGRMLLVSIFAPSDWSPEKVVSVAGSLFVLIGLVKMFKKKH